MSNGQKYTLENVVEDEVLLIAIHSTIEDFRIAYFINHRLNIQLKRSQKDLDFITEEKKLLYSKFEYHDTHFDDSFYLISNQCKINSQRTGNNKLFNNDFEEITYHLIPEYKKTDYFFKIHSENAEGFRNTFVSKLQSIPLISTAYAVDFENLKSKNNLKFH